MFGKLPQSQKHSESRNGVNNNWPLHTLAMCTSQQKTTRVVRVPNMMLGLIQRFAQILVIVYVLVYSIWHEKGYQVGRGWKIGIVRQPVKKYPIRQDISCFHVRPWKILRGHLILETESKQESRRSLQDIFTVPNDVIKVLYEAIRAMKTDGLFHFESRASDSLEADLAAFLSRVRGSPKK